MPKKPQSLEIQQILQILENLAPAGTAESWDNVGLLAGDPKWKTSGAVVSIDLTEEALKLAKDEKYRLIVTHHPCIFPKHKGLSRLTTQHLAVRALTEGVAVVSCHTNFDQCALEVVREVSEGLGVKPMGRLIESGETELLKLVVFVPEKHLDPVRQALSQAGAGQIGNYDSCTFATRGEGTFRGKDGSKPFLGKPGKLEKAQEFRLETIFPKGLQQSILQTLRETHPYEEIAYDLYPVEQEPVSKGISRGLGYGFFGDFPQALPFSEVAQCVKELFRIDGFWITEKTPSKISRIGYVAGKGASFVASAASAGCDLLITGEVGYHSALEGTRRKMGVMEIGHRESERFFLSTMAEWLSDAGLKTVELNEPTQRIWQGGFKK